MARSSRGEIWFADLAPHRGHEQGFQRPVVVVSTDGFNHGPAGLMVILPLTTRERPGILWRVPIHPPECGVKRRSFIMCDAPRTIATDRLLEDNPWGSVSPDTMAAIEDRLRALLDL